MEKFFIGIIRIEILNFILIEMNNVIIYFVKIDL